jgi:biopolymer transport protein ExbD
MAKAPPKNPALPPDESPREIVVAVDTSGTITIDGQAITLADFPTRLKEVAEGRSMRAAQSTTSKRNHKNRKERLKVLR